MKNDLHEEAFLMLMRYSFTLCLGLSLTTNIFEQGEQYGQKH